MTVKPTVSNPGPEREPEPLIHYDLDTIEERAACGYDLGVQGPDGWSTNPALVTCPQCATTLVDGQLAEPKRQFCRKGIHTAIPAVTLTFDGGARRLHWCAEHAADADGYRDSSDQADRASAVPERTDWAAMSDDELEGRIRSAFYGAAEFPELAPPIGPAPAAEHRTIGLEVLTDELRALAIRLAHSDIREEMAAAKVAIVVRRDGEIVAPPDTDAPWLTAKHGDEPVYVLRGLLSEMISGAARLRREGVNAELLMPGADVLAALSGQPVGGYTAAVPSSYGVVQAGWYVGVETRLGDGSEGLEWLLVEDRASCSDPGCVVADGVAKDCNVVTVRGRGVQHLKTWWPVYVRIPADTEVQR